MSLDIRWVHRYNNYCKALKTLEDAIELSKTRPLSDLEEQGLIQSFEFTFELSWKLLKDYLENKAFANFHGSRDTFRLAFSEGLIANGALWMKMIDDRNRTAHTYDEAVAEAVSSVVISDYISLFADLREDMQKRLPKEEK
jgi:nucleotidyltransferase substrate binding protein (TIGR01987 family)